MKLQAKALATAAVFAASLATQAQGLNTGMGGSDGDIESISRRVAKIEKKNDAFNLYLNYAASAQAEYDSRDASWSGRFANKQLRLEITGNLTDRLFYRLRHRLNRSSDAKGGDNFALATDIMMVGYRFSDKLAVQAGKMCQIWGGFEFDENPMTIYQYSDYGDNIDPFKAGITVSYRPTPTQELAVEVSNTFNETLDKEFGPDASLVDRKRNIYDAASHTLRKSSLPFTYIVNWNGSFLDGLFTTRWAYGVSNPAKHQYNHRVTLGQKLSLPHAQWYVDYMGAFESVDCLGYATADLYYGFRDLGYYPSYAVCGSVDSHSFISKLNWQFAPRWNLMLKCAYETTSMRHVPKYRNYRKAYSYLAGMEYYPVKRQDFRVFLAYVGRSYNFSSDSELNNYNTSRIELGFMYRIKAY